MKYPHQNHVPQIFFNADAGAATGTGTGGTLLGATGTGDGGGQASGGAAGGSGASAVSTPDRWFKDASTGTLSDNWRDNLPDDLRGAEPLKVIGSFSDLAKAYVSTKALVGKKLEAPSSDATPEQVAAWRKVIGAPDKPEGYRGDAKTLRPDTVPEGLWDAASEGKFLELAHKHHLTPAAVKEILGFHAEAVKGGLEKGDVESKAMLAAEGMKLKEAWGDKYNEYIERASRMAKTVGLDPMKNPLFEVAENVIAFAKMAQLVSESSLIKGDNVSLSSTLASRASDITDPKSQSQLAREYRGEFGQERQAAAQVILHDLLRQQTPKAA